MLLFMLICLIMWTYVAFVLHCLPKACDWFNRDVNGQWLGMDRQGWQAERISGRRGEENKENEGNTLKARSQAASSQSEWKVSYKEEKQRKMPWGKRYTSRNWSHQERYQNSIAENTQLSKPPKNKRGQQRSRNKRPTNKVST